jgi:hypothetical protein
LCCLNLVRQSRLEGLHGVLTVDNINLSDLDRPTIYVAITNHGFGHAARTAALVGEIQRRLPTVRAIITTTAPRWLIASYLPQEFIYRPYSYDVGVIQVDSLQMDLPATLNAWQKIRSSAAEIINNEALFLREQSVDLVLADVPPLAGEIAHRANVPCWAATNFAWDFIYQDWGADFAELTDWIGQGYGACDRLFRLPFHESLDRFSNIVDVGLTGGKPYFTEADLRHQLDFDHPKEKTAMLVFGGLGLQDIPYQNVHKFPDWQFLTFDKSAPQLPNLRIINDPASDNDGEQRSYRPVDIFPICGLVVSKPGYTTYAEAMLADLPVATISRSGFAESEILQSGLQDHSWHQMIESADFFQGDWEFLQQPMLPPRQGCGLPKDGTESIAQAVVKYLAS